MAKSRSQLVNLAGAQPLMNSLAIYNGIDNVANRMSSMASKT